MALVIIVLLCFAVISGKNDAQHQYAQEGQTSATQSEESETWWHFATKDPSGLFTLWLAVIGFGQAALFFWQLSLIGKGLADGEKAANAALKAADAAGRQVEIMNISFASVERPYVFIGNVSGTKSDDDEELYITYTVSNFGRIPAIIDQAFISFVFEDKIDVPQLPPLVFESHTLMQSPIMSPDSSREILEYLPAGLGDGGLTITLGTGGLDLPLPTVSIPKDQTLFFRAIIRYRGPFTVEHETAGLWYLDPSGQMLCRLGRGYNYVK